MLTFQDFMAVSEGDRADFIARLIAQHEASDLVRTARIANEYDAQRNVTIRKAVPMMYAISGVRITDKTRATHHIASNFFHKLNGQRVNYLMTNGMTFSDDAIKDVLGGSDADVKVRRAAYYALIHGVCFLFLNVDRLYIFPVTEFAPLYDEETGALAAGVRYWRIDASKPMTAVLYESDGYTVYRSDGGGNALTLSAEKRAYKLTVAKAQADTDALIVGAENYSALPIVELWGSDAHQSTLVGMQETIDAYDLIQSGFVSDLETCAEAFMLLENYGGMTDSDLAEFRDRLKMHKIGVIDTAQGGKLSMQQMEVPHAARGACLDRLRRDIYEHFGALDTASIAAGSKTATEIKAAYQGLSDAADELEYQIIACVRQLLALVGIDDTPTFKRSQISNELEQTQMIMQAQEYLDDETILNKLPFISPDEIEGIRERMLAQHVQTIDMPPAQTEDDA